MSKETFGVKKPEPDPKKTKQVFGEVEKRDAWSVYSQEPPSPPVPPKPPPTADGEEHEEDDEELPISSTFEINMLDEQFLISPEKPGDT